MNLYPEGEDLQTSNLHVVRTRPLVPPGALKEALPVSRSAAQTVVQSRLAIRQIMAGQDPRLLAIVGPCSIHDGAAARDYAARLLDLHRRVTDAVFVVMRVYFEKPRTVVGWKGFINDPLLDGSCDAETGMRLAREMLVEIAGMGLPAATEFLDPVTPQYMADLVSWAAIGARTTESQTHREMASGLSMPVGFKNGTDGDLQTALNAMLAAGAPHTFLGIDQDGRSAIVYTTGNPDRHLVLRGGRGGPNYRKADVERASTMLREAGLNPRVMVDCSHANAGKDPARQEGVLRDLMNQVRMGARNILGVMVESHLHGGNQKVGPDPKALRYGVSITDPCIDWETTVRILEQAAGEWRAATLA